MVDVATQDFRASFCQTCLCSHPREGLISYSCGVGFINPYLRQMEAQPLVDLGQSRGSPFTDKSS